mmetsp:Transcript_15821/g.33246  ORF Transcript_15821/g.33246 Transcript_15821/m.33246 type:complete len:146 (-) Transcript_15821:712-1149(-)
MQTKKAIMCCPLMTEEQREILYWTTVAMLTFLLLLLSVTLATRVIAMEENITMILSLVSLLQAFFHVLTNGDDNHNKHYCGNSGGPNEMHLIEMDVRGCFKIRGSLDGICITCLFSTTSLMVSMTWDNLPVNGVAGHIPTAVRSR